MLKEKTVRIIGIPMFGVQESIQCFGVEPTNAQLDTLSVIPFSKQELREAKDTHILVATLPLSILDIRGKVDQSLFYHTSNPWYGNEKFAKDKGQAGWHLVRKTIVPNSTNKTYPEQQALLAENEETSSACVMVYAIIGHYLATGERLLGNIRARCSELDSPGIRVDVGNFVSFGLLVGRYWDDGRSVALGMASSWKFS